MAQQSGRGLKCGNADGYDSYMGGWSAAPSPLFVDFVGIEALARVIDIGCGTGNLLAALAASHSDASLVGIDPSEALLTKARMRSELAGATFKLGGVEALPVETGGADYTLSMLVLQEFSDRALALSEMCRVRRPGGVVAACQWDFARMPVIAALVEAIEHVNATAGRKISGGSPRAFADEAELLMHWDEAGSLTSRPSASQSDARIRPSMISGGRFLWDQPSTLTLASLEPAQRELVRQNLLGRFASSLAGTIEVTEEALVVRGNSPADATSNAI